MNGEVLVDRLRNIRRRLNGPSLPDGDLIPTGKRESLPGSHQFTASVILTHLLLALLGSLWYQNNPAAIARFFDALRFKGDVFFSQLFISGIFIYSAVLALRYFRSTECTSCLLAATALSLANSILLAADAFQSTNATPSNQITSAWGMLHSLITERQSLLALSLFTLVGVVAGTYYVIRSFFVVEYKSTGIQIKLPGYTSYFVPIFPQISWQDTRIQLKQGDRVRIEISGSVSPGALQSFEELKGHMAKFLEWQKTHKTENCTVDKKELLEPINWPYTGPEGYPEKWYSSEKPRAISRNEAYQIDNFYEQDECLTVRGAPHNRVYGIILPAPEKPKDASKLELAYDLQNEEDRKQLINLSRPDCQYPFDLEIPKTGRLWVVINDVDVARWDNVGLFFLKLTHYN